jgi:hypothetical protein
VVFDQRLVITNAGSEFWQGQEFFGRALMSGLDEL